MDHNPITPQKINLRGELRHCKIFILRIALYLTSESTSTYPPNLLNSIFSLTLSLERTDIICPGKPQPYLAEGVPIALDLSMPLILLVAVLSSEQERIDQLASNLLPDFTDSSQLRSW